MDDFVCTFYNFHFSAVSVYSVCVCLCMCVCNKTLNCPEFVRKCHTYGVIPCQNAPLRKSEMKGCPYLNRRAELGGLLWHFRGRMKILKVTMECEGK